MGRRIRESALGACKMVTVLPSRHRRHASFPITFSLSPRKYEASTAVTTTESAPSGVTREAGTKA